MQGWCPRHLLAMGTRTQVRVLGFPRVFPPPLYALPALSRVHPHEQPRWPLGNGHERGLGGRYPVYISLLVPHRLGVPEKTWGKIGGFLTCDQEHHSLTGERPDVVAVRTKTPVRPRMDCGHRPHGELCLKFPMSALWAAGSPLLEQKECACCSLQMAMEGHVLPWGHLRPGLNREGGCVIHSCERRSLRVKGIFTCLCTSHHPWSLRPGITPQTIALFCVLSVSQSWLCPLRSPPSGLRYSRSSQGCAGKSLSPSLWDLVLRTSHISII